MLSSLKILELLWLVHVWLTVFLSLHGIPAFIQSGNVLWNLTMAALVKIFSLLVFEPLCMLLIINVTVESLKKAHVCYKCITWRLILRNVRTAGCNISTTITSVNNIHHSCLLDFRVKFKCSFRIILSEETAAISVGNCLKVWFACWKRNPQEPNKMHLDQVFDTARIIYSAALYECNMNCIWFS